MLNFSYADLKKYFMASSRLLARCCVMVGVIGTVLLPLPAAQAQKHAVYDGQDDTIFLALRDAAKREDIVRSEQQAARLQHYDMQSYVDYYRLKPRLRHAAETEIRDYLRRYDGTAIADRLRNDWLLELGRVRDWTTFDEQYPLFVLDDDVQVKCYALLSQANKNRIVAEDAKKLLVSSREYGDGCFALATALVQNGQFQAQDIWAQLRLAVEGNAPAVARRLGALIDVQEAQIMRVFDKPAAILSKKIIKHERFSQDLFLLALARVAATSPDSAAATLQQMEASLLAPERAVAWSLVALQASMKLMQGVALEHWRKAEGAPLSQESMQWKVRIALRAGDWKMVKETIEAMPWPLSNDPTWVYWLGRAYLVENNPEMAQLLFRSIADKIHFYGQLALEELGQKTLIPARAAALSKEEMTAIAGNVGLRRALRFFAMNLRFEAVREWNWELRKLSEREHLAAAEFARQNSILDRMVNTSDRTTKEFDFTQRYPTPFRDFMQNATRALNMDMAWVYGLIRQESRFIMSARSHVGASGLMQLMPATARYVATKIGMNDFVPERVTDVNTNIQLGTNYLNMVYRDLDASQLLASAAYNAGPGRPRAWRATLSRPVEGAIFAESIPFNETRGYVKNVLSNATYYAALFDNKPQSLKARLGVVVPKGFAPTDLP